MKILCFGSVNMDHVYRVPHFVMPGETLSSISVVRNLGGKGANQAIALAKAGLDVYLAGNIGADGAKLADTLQGYGVKLDWLRRDSEMTGNAIIQVDDRGQNSIILFPGANYDVTSEQIDSVLTGFEKGDWLVLQNEINMLPLIMEKAHEKGLRICFNPAPFTDEIKSFPLSLVDLLVVNEIEGADLAGLPYEEEPERMISELSVKYPSGDILLTLGSRGSMMKEAGSDEVYYQDIMKTEVVDTTAAGDTFIGYYLASRVKGLDIASSLRTATRASSITVSRSGAAKSIPSAEEVFI